ncbi:RES domain-containing protein (plasmid) [Alteromonas mediterranea 615]|uniref:RES domain-containing protein n=1 Tax=Alteromonas mediterranea 615 TaxID=1300253 RepID=S5ALT0_9ALTE|nr:RES domain-containing protein [Alteromonas mediterranea 615]
MSQLHLYRIVKKKWVHTAFDGEGALRHGGRWNSAGRACIYTASSESLAVLEVLVHLEDDDCLEHYRLFRLSVDESQVLNLSILPDNWREYPAPKETSDIGDQWLASQASCVLRVPSCIVPREYNFLINPSHPDIDELLSSVEELPVNFDPRLMK